ncbi:uncharacterized protein LOC119512148 [Choloepus didactylus]|uniref:uncharacterized protein LOC119512148 n=1 Tax=Choloepus didactylus TaxID=27675 RepID=UPI0018A02CEC|nr:uncharacterized protein LOC119512148 [Choloepus didactylus]
MESSYPMSNISENIKFSSNSKLQELFRKIFGYPQLENLKSAEFPSSSMELVEPMAEVFDEIPQQVFSKVPSDPTIDETRRSSAKSATKSIPKPVDLKPKKLKATEFMSNSKRIKENLREIFDEILWQELSRVPYNPAFDEIRSTTAKSITEKVTKSSPTQKKYLKPTEFASKFKEQEKNSNEIFDEILQQVLSRVPYNPAFDEIRSMAAISTTKNFMNPSYPHPEIFENIKFASSSVKPAEPKAKILGYPWPRTLKNPDLAPNLKKQGKNLFGYLQLKTLQNTEFPSSSIKPAERVAQIFDELLRHRLSKVTYYPTFQGMRSTAAESTTNSIMNPNYPQPKPLENTEFASSSVKSKESMAEIFDKILRQRISKVINNPTFHEMRSTVATSNTNNVMNPSYVQTETLQNTEYTSSSIKPEDSMAKIFDEILRQKVSEVTNNPKFYEMQSTSAKSTTNNVMNPSYPQPQTLQNTEFASSSFKPEDSMLKIFYEILRQGVSEVTYNPKFYEMRNTSAKSTTNNVMNPNEILRERVSNVTYYPTFHEMRSTSAKSVANNVMVPSYAQPKTFQNTEDTSFKPEDSMAKIFYEILRQGLSRATYNTTFQDMRSLAAKLTTNDIRNPNEILRERASKVTYNATLPEVRSAAATSTTSDVVNPRYTQQKALKHTMLSSNFKDHVENLPMILDEVLQRASSEVPYNHKFDETTRSAAKSTTKNIIKPKEYMQSGFKHSSGLSPLGYPQQNVMEYTELASNLKTQENGFTNLLGHPQQNAVKYTEFASNLKTQRTNFSKILDEILQRASSKDPYNPKFDEATSSAAKSTTKNIMKPSYPQQKAMKYTEFASNLKNQEKNLTKILDEFLGHATSKVPYNPKFEETTSSAAKSTSKKIMKPSKYMFLLTRFGAAQRLPALLPITSRCRHRLRDYSSTEELPKQRQRSWPYM